MKRVYLLIISVTLAFTFKLSLEAKNKQVLVLAVHGLGARAASLDPLKEKLEAQGIKFVARDLPGFGLNHKAANSESEFQKGHIESYKDWLDFVSLQIKDLKKTNPDAKLIVLGHSLGGLIVTNTPNINRADALILSVPGYASGTSFNPGFLLETAWKYAIDKAIFGTDKYIEMPASKRIYPSPQPNDPHKTKSMTANLLIEIKKLQFKTKENLTNLSMPLMMIQIKEDSLVDTKLQEEFFEKMPSTNKTLKVYEGFDHDWISDPEIDEIVNELLEFCKSL